jgi:hypothetical protein
MQRRKISSARAMVGSASWTALKLVCISSPIYPDTCGRD